MTATYLPEEILVEVLIHLHRPDVITCLQVNSHWHRVACGNFIYGYLQLPTIERMEGCLATLEETDRNRRDQYRKSSFSRMDYGSLVKSIDLSPCVDFAASVGAEQIRRLWFLCPNVESIAVAKHNDINDDILKEILEGFPRLKNINFSRTNLNSSFFLTEPLLYSNVYQRLETLNINFSKPPKEWSPLLAFPSLTAFSTDIDSQQSYDMVHHIVSDCANTLQILTLGLRSSYQYRHGDLDKILREAPRLRNIAVDIQGHSEPPLVTAFGPDLIELAIEGRCGDETARAVSKIKGLKRLCLNCTEISQSHLTLSLEANKQTLLSLAYYETNGFVMTEKMLQCCTNLRSFRGYLQGEHSGFIKTVTDLYADQLEHLFDVPYGSLPYPNVFHPVPGFWEHVSQRVWPRILALNIVNAPLEKEFFAQLPHIFPSVEYLGIGITSQWKPTTEEWEDWIKKFKNLRGIFIHLTMLDDYPAFLSPQPMMRLQTSFLEWYLNVQYGKLKCVSERNPLLWQW